MICSSLDPKNIGAPYLKKKEIFTGDTATLEGCVFSSLFNNDINISWLKDGSVLEVESQFTSQWNTDSFNISVSALTLKNLNFSDIGNYSCRLSYNKDFVSEVVSPTVRLDVSSNKVIFTSKPTIRRTLEQTVINGCSYSSSRSFDLASYSYIVLGGETFNVNRSQAADEAGSFIMGNYTFSHFVKNGPVKCLIEIGDEKFTSNTSTIYENPGNYISCLAISSSFAFGQSGMNLFLESR